MRPYAQKILSDYLREHPSIDTRVVSKPPDGDRRDTSWIMVTRLSAPQAPNSRHDHIVEFYFQIDCYASATGGQPESETLETAVIAALIEMPNAQHDDAVVTATRIRGARPMPDTQMEPSRDRQLVFVSIWMHSVLAAV